MPNISTVMRWLRDNGEFRNQYAIAREAQAEYLVDEIVEIADDATNDWMKRQRGDDDGAEAPNHEHINRSRLRIDARKWAASKMAPKKYGDKLAHELTGKDGGPIKTEEISDSARARALAAFIAKTKASDG